MTTSSSASGSRGQSDGTRQYRNKTTGAVERLDPTTDGSVQARLDAGEIEEVPASEQQNR